MDVHPSYRIGKRTVKTTIATLLAMVYMVLAQRGTVIAPLCAVIAMKTTQEDSLKTLKLRLLATFIGGVIGLIVIEIGLLVPNYYYGWNILLVSIAIMLDIYVCNALNVRDAVVLSAATILVVTNVQTIVPQDRIWYTLGRIIDTAVGAVIATLVNVYLWPARPGAKPVSIPQGSQMQEMGLAEDLDETLQVLEEER